MISIITPTYNRAYILPALYQSLKKQSSKDFEWVIIDDGSTDNTKDIVKSWIEEGSICLSYYKKENGGKHRALNYGIPKCAYDYIFIVDSDDYLLENSVKDVNTWIEEIAGRNDIAGVAGLRCYPDGTIIGKRNSKAEFVECKNSHRVTNSLTGDKAEIYKKQLLLDNPFPEFDNEKFIGEGSVWNRLSLMGYKVRWYDKAIYVGSYLPDGLTANATRLAINNYKGYCYTTRLCYKTFPFPYNFISLALFFRVASEKGIGLKTIQKELDINGFSCFCSYLLWEIVYKGKLRLK